MSISRSSATCGATACTACSSSSCVSPPFNPLTTSLTCTALDMYYESFPNDRPGIKVLGKWVTATLLRHYINATHSVWTVFLLESTFTAFMTAAAWFAYGPGWGDVDTLGNRHWSWDTFAPLTAIGRHQVYCDPVLWRKLIWRL